MVTKASVRQPLDFIEFREESIYQGIHERFEDQVRLYPDNVALQTFDRSLSYSATNGAVNSLADEILSACGKGLGQAAILLPNNCDTIISISPSDRVTWCHSPCFGSSVIDIYCCLTNGGSLYPWDAKAQGLLGMSDWLVNAKMTTFQWIPCAFRQFMKTVPEGTVFDDVRLVIMAG